MCGVVGVWLRGRDRERALEAVERAAASLAHRGPDDRGVVEVASVKSRDSIVLGHRRLSIIDLSEAGHQPMLDTETGNWIVYNGEVYNFREIRAELESLGYRFRSDSDTEVILLSYRQWGPDCVTRWRGMFAAAIWDEPRQELFLVRDRLGVKPLYYSYTDGTFLFASELRAIVETGLISPKLNVAALNAYLMFGAVQDPLTLIADVQALPAAHTLTVRDDGLKLQEYWELPLGDGRYQEGHSSAEVERVAERLKEAVSLRLVSDVPLGVFLSGGIDSSGLAMLMQRLSPQQVKAFTIGFINKKFDEATQARQTALKLGVEHHSIMLTEADMLASCEDAVDALDQPSIDGINTYYVSRSVKQAGITVALSGLGGDEAFCGYPHFRTIPRMRTFEHSYARLPYFIRQVGASLVGAGKSDKSSKIHALLLDEYGFTDPYFLARALFLPNQIASLVEPDALLAIEYGAWGCRFRQIMARAEALDPINRISYLELKTYIANTLLRDTDATSMAHSLEVRVPLLDHLLLEDVMRIAGRLKLRPKITKPLLVNSLPGTLPRGVMSGPKRGFTLPFA
ncbi:MAG: asparagine synthase (glutamine-hydrolyzing), partial [Acidobacteriota bacterium]|nr:asparagine synthase (glutamine-hydrolyzing) [Acidobacteriota bacterium]